MLHSLFCHACVVRDRVLHILGVAGEHPTFTDKVVGPGAGSGVAVASPAGIIRPPQSGCEYLPEHP